jgi:hypothetical protein
VTPPPSSRLAALLSVTALACASPPAAPVEEDAGPDQPGAAVLVSMSPEVSAACPDEVTATACSTHAAAALARACRARLAARGVACAAPEACLAIYQPRRDGACRAGATYPDRASCAEPVADDCAFYRACLEAGRPCGATGYALAFGERLCHAFVARREEFSPAGQAWLRGVRTCLQRALTPLLADATRTCAALEDAAYASHAGCYTAAGNPVCALPSSDLAALTRALAPWLRDPRAVAQVGEVLRSCAPADAGAR